MRTAKWLVTVACLQMLMGCPGGGGGGDGGGDAGASGSAGTSGAGASGAGSSGMGGGASGAGSSGTGGTSGAGAGGAGGGGATEVPAPTTTLSSLTAAQAQGVCDSAAEIFVTSLASNEDFTRYSCTLVALVFTLTTGSDGMPMVDQAACQQMVTDCIAGAEDPEESDVESTCTPTAVMTALADCDATFGDLDACMRASIASLNGQFEMLTCASPISAIQEDPAAMTDSAECMALEAQCPGILDQLDQEAGVGIPSIDDGGTGGTGELVGPGGCTNTCVDANDDFCDDGGDGFTPLCDFGTDCADCGERPAQ